MDFANRLKFIIFFVAILSLPLAALGDEERIPKRAETRTASLYWQVKNYSASSLSLQVVVNPGGQAINAVGFSLLFPTDQLSVKSIDTTKSFCELTVFNSFDNNIGQANLGCGKPYPGISTTSEVATINFSLKKGGKLDLSFADPMVLANDGYGTDVLLSTSSQAITIK